jgi:hypothetical protein
MPIGLYLSIGVIVLIGAVIYTAYHRAKRVEEEHFDLALNHYSYQELKHIMKNLEIGLVPPHTHKRLLSLLDGTFTEEFKAGPMYYIGCNMFVDQDGWIDYNLQNGKCEQTLTVNILPST